MALENSVLCLLVQPKRGASVQGVHSHRLLEEEACLCFSRSELREELLFEPHLPYLVVKKESPGIDGFDGGCERRRGRRG
jgi:hypothetical protein